MKKILFLIALFFCSAILKAQIRERVIFIGDAGDISPQQNKLITDATSKIIEGKTRVVYLGNNIYPNGMDLKKGRAQVEDKQILETQFKPMVKKGAEVYFIPGNRDWDNSGTKGLAKVEKQFDYLKSQYDSLLKMLPPHACPDPIVISVSDNLTMIIVDTEWWLYPFDKKQKNDDCNCHSKDDVVLELRKILNQNLDQNILLVTHHPFQTNGRYGGKFSWKDHIFPLTELNPNLYLPLPGIGSLYPLFRTAFPGREDLHHPQYQEMSRRIGEVFRGFPNMVHISAHEDGLQLLQDSVTYQTQIVTGIGRKKPYLRKEENTVFEAAVPGYVVADELADHKMHFSFYGHDENKNITLLYQYTKQHKPFKNWNSSVYTPIKADSVTVAVHPDYIKKGGFYRFLFGENYRNAWAVPVKLPVLHLSQMQGGLKVRKLGGGQQTVSMRLKDSTGYQYVLRSVEKTPNRVIPHRFESPFTLELVEDFYSSQHPFSALMVPPIAEATGVPHTNPIIGLVSPDTILGFYAEQFAGKVNLFEAWEPLQPTDNYTKALKKLRHDNDNTFDGVNFLKARMLDLLIGDWDRHKDQWRFNDTLRGKHKHYLIVPRDRDMAINVTNGLLVGFGKYFFLTPHVYGFKENLVGQVNQYLYKSDFLNAEPAAQINYNQWMKEAHDFKNKVTDSVLKASVKAMPSGLDSKENKKILEILKERRNEIPEAMDKYYKFSNKIVDIHGTNRKEFVSIKGLKDKDALGITMRKIDKHGQLQDTLMSKTYLRSMTKEIRLYLEKDRDSVVVDNPSSSIKLRFIGGEPRHDSHKSYNIIQSKNKIKVYDYQPEQYYGKSQNLKKYISKDSANTAFVPVNLYNDWLPLATAGFNRDDGLYFGLGAKFIQRRGFRKTPDVAVHQLMLNHSLHTSAYEIKYKSDWRDVFGKANLLFAVDVKAPDNTQNFFGIGNESRYLKVGNHHSYYRTRFNLYNFKTALKWEWERNMLSVGPSLQYYHYNPEDNINRYSNEINDPFSPDRATISKNKLHLGLVADYELDHRDNPLLPTDGFYINMHFKAYAGLDAYAKSFAQIAPEISFYKHLNPGKTLILTDRIGGAVTVGDPAFYQYAYLGGQGNLLGYRKYRFAGMQSFYNNLEMRLVLIDFGNTYFIGQLGLSGFYDIGRVWIDGEDSQKWHNGVGGGIYFAPAYSAVLHFDMGYSREGWYPYVSFGLRF